MDQNESGGWAPRIPDGLDLEGLTFADLDDALQGVKVEVEGGEVVNGDDLAAGLANYEDPLEAIIVAQWTPGEASALEEALGALKRRQ